MNLSAAGNGYFSDGDILMIVWMVWMVTKLAEVMVCSSYPRYPSALIAKPAPASGSVYHNDVAAAFSAQQPSMLMLLFPTCRWQLSSRVWQIEQLSLISP